MLHELGTTCSSLQCYGSVANHAELWFYSDPCRQVQSLHWGLCIPKVYRGRFSVLGYQEDLTTVTRSFQLQGTHTRFVLEPTCTNPLYRGESAAAMRANLSASGISPDFQAIPTISQLLYLNPENLPHLIQKSQILRISEPGNQASTAK